MSKTLTKFLATGTLILTMAAASSAQAACVTKAAEATAGSESGAKWFVMETIVQQVSWGLWPGWVATVPQ